MNLQIKYDPNQANTYNIYADNRCIAIIRHDIRGEGLSLTFVERSINTSDWMFDNVNEFLIGGGSEPLDFTNTGIEYLTKKIAM